MRSTYLLSALAVIATSIHAAEMGPSDGTPSIDGTMFNFMSGSDGEGVVVGPKGINAWGPSASNNTCVPKGAEGIKSVAASSPALDFREDRTYCVLGFTSDNCIGETVVGKEYQAPVVRLMHEDAPPTWTYNFEIDVSSAKVVSGACPMTAGDQTSSGDSTSSAAHTATESQESSNIATGDQKPSNTQATDPAQSSEAQAADPQQSSNAQRAIPFMRPLLLYIVFIAYKLF